MPLVIYGIGGVHTHAHMQRTFADKSGYKKPDRRTPGLIRKNVITAIIESVN